MTKLVSVFNQKGGVGKTLIALHVAAALDARGFSVLLSDLDEQGSAIYAANRRKVRFPVIAGMPNSEQIKGIDFVIADHAPRIEDVPSVHSYAVIVPVQPSEVDWHAFKRTLNALKSHKNVIPVMNRDNRGGIARAMRDWFAKSEFADVYCSIPDRRALNNFDSEVRFMRAECDQIIDKFILRDGGSYAKESCNK